MTQLPNLFIVGAPKSGTTSLYEWLKDHPQVFMSPVKEPNYFARDLWSSDHNTLRYEVDVERYRELFADARDALRLGEASVRYLYSKDAPALIRADQPEAHIVVALRNPVEMAHSLHSHQVAGGSEDLADFEQAIAAEDDRRAGRRIPANANPRLCTYRDRALYGEQLPRWIDAFGRERVHVIVFEELTREPAAHFRRLLEFLDIDPEYQPEAFRAHNVAHGTRSRVMRRMLDSRLPQWLVWKALPRVIGDLRTRALVQRFRHSRFHRRPAERAPISPRLRRRLELEFAPDVAQLSQILDRDMGQFWFGMPAGTAGAADVARDTITAS